jgi:S1-C subfamily serine protease
VTADETKPHRIPQRGTDQDGEPSEQERPRLAPRPTFRPTVSDGEQQVFSRPDGVAGSFAPGGADRGERQPAPSAPDPVLIEAFSRPRGSTDLLQRDPYAGPLRPEPEPEPVDPWRDTESTASLGGPGVPAEPTPEPQPDPERLGVRDVLFGGRVSYRSLAVLAVIALVIGLVGGFVGRLTGSTVVQLTDSRVSLPIDHAKAPDDGPYAAVAARVAPSVVTVTVTTAEGGDTGSGSIIDARGGYILTNNHVVADATTGQQARIEVTFNDQTKVPAKLVGADSGADVAVIQVQVNGLQQITLGDSDQLVPGQPVVAIGSPRGLQRTVTTGVVSALHRPVQEPNDGPGAPAVFDAVQTDASINPGNSGGPLLDLKGRQIGMNTLISTESGGSEGLGFAIASNVFQPIAEALIRGEKPVHAEIGINGRQVINDRATGVRVENVKKGSAAERAGIREGDVITKVGDTLTPDAAAVAVAIRAVGVGKEATITVVRGDRSVPIKVIPTAAP